MNIRQATLADKPAIFDFLRLAYPSRWQYKFPERWEWEFERNPYISGDLPIWIALDGNRIVGQSCALVEPLVIHGKEYSVGWGVDFFVLPDYRGQGLGTQLQKANDGGQEIFMSLSMAAVASRIKSTIGLQPLPPVPVFTKIVHHDPESFANTLAVRTKIPQRIIRRTKVHHLGAAFLTAKEKQRNRALILPPQDVEITPVQRFGPESDALWTQLSDKYAALIRRDAAYLNWKFVNQPHVQFERYLAWREKVIGHVIFRRAQPPERNAGLILDVFADPEDETALQALLACAVKNLQAKDVTYIQIASSVPKVQQILSMRGFKQTKSTTPMIRAEITIPQSGWLLGKGDHDWDQFPLA